MANLPIQLVETSPQLRTIQKQRIKAASIAWHDDVQSLPNAALFGVANEFFDALPIDQAVWRQGAWRHRLVTATHGALGFVDGPALNAPELARWLNIARRLNQLYGNWLAASRAMAGHV
jgi:NADH dehydrogenase [ubiquinone] 1 alpha subcomplex assembly factor 7